MDVIKVRREQSPVCQFLLMISGSCSVLFSSVMKENCARSQNLNFIIFIFIVIFEIKARFLFFRTFLHLIFEFKFQNLSTPPHCYQKIHDFHKFSFSCSVERWTFHFCVVFKFLITSTKRFNVPEWKASTLRRFALKNLLKVVKTEQNGIKEKRKRKNNDEDTLRLFSRHNSSSRREWI